MKPGLALAACLLSLIILPASAQEVFTGPPPGQLGGGDLANLCRGLYDVDAGYCAGYIKAVADILQQQTLYGQRVCNLGPVPAQQLMELIKEQMDDTPGVATQSASQVVVDALAKYYPCR